MENQIETISCPSCKTTIPAGMFFCPNCGKQLKYKPVTITLAKQIIVYAVSLFLPPLGLIYAFKYFKEGDSKSRKIALVAVVLTIVSLLFTFWVTKGFFDSISQSLDQIKSLNI